MASIPTARPLSVGMGGMAVAIIGGPFTMTFLVLETTGDFALTAATLTASITASLIVRDLRIFVLNMAVCTCAERPSAARTTSRGCATSRRGG